MPNLLLWLWLCISVSLSYSSYAVDCSTDTIGLCSPTIEEIIDEVVAQGKENILIVFYAGPNSRKYIGAKLSLD